MTEIGDLNRGIEKSIQELVEGKKNSLGKALSLARQREDLLKAKPFLSKPTEKTP
jgi:hypothetical protein